MPQQPEPDDPPQRSAMVTGAARGIGRAIALRLAADGLAVSVADLPSAQAELEKVVAELEAIGVRALAVQVDVTDAGAVDEAVAVHVSHFGGLDVMVANAGIAVTAPLIETSAEQWQRTMDVNLKGVFHCYQAAARQMIAQGRGGRLIGAASVAAHRGGKWQGAYSASKFAVRGLSQSVESSWCQRPVNIEACEGRVQGAGAQAWANSTPRFRIASSPGVVGLE